MAKGQKRSTREKKKPKADKKAKGAVTPALFGAAGNQQRSGQAAAKKGDR